MAATGPARWKRAFLAVLALAAVLRVAAVLTVGDVPELHNDEGYYVEAGRSLARGLGYPDSARPPGFPFLVAAVFRVWGESLTAVRLAQVPVSLLAVAAVFDLSRRRFGLRAGVASGVLCAVHPELVHYTHFLWSETLFTTLLMIAVWALDRFESSPRPRWIALAGIGLGLAALTREMILPFVVLAAGWVWLLPGGRRNVRPAFLLCAAAALVILPWTARNYTRQHRVVLISTIRWFPVAMGNLLPPDGAALGRDSAQQFASRYFAIPDEIEREALARAVALRAIAQAQPGWLGRKLVRNLYGLFTPWTQLARFERSRWLAPRWEGLARCLLPVEMALSELLLGLGIVGLWTVPGGRLKSLLAALVLFFLALHVAANANHRFRVPLLPVFALYGGALLDRPAAALRSRVRLAAALISLGALALTLAVFLRRGPGATGQPEPAGPGRPLSVVLVSIDTLRPDHLGCYGYGRPTSPGLDALAREGTVFENAFTPSSWTLPAHASMLSGLSPFRHGAVDATTRIADDVPLVAETLRSRGYHTLAAVGGPFLGSRYGFARGFERWLERPMSGTDPDRYQAELLGAVRGLRPPFFAFLHYMSVHSPYTPPPRFNRFVPLGAVRAPRTRVGRLQRLMDQGGERPTPAEREALIGLYDGEILAMDERLGQTLAELRRLFGEDVLVVVTSDHGEEFLEHGGLMHGRTLYDELLRVALVVRGPRLPPGRRVREMVSLLDIAPTLLDWAGGSAPRPLDGRSLLPLLRGAAGGGLGLLPLHTRAHDRRVDLWGLRSPTAKLILDRQSGRRQFYLLDEDPGEQRNLYPDPRAAALERAVDALTLQTGSARPRLAAEEAEALKALGYH